MSAAPVYEVSVHGRIAVDRQIFVQPVGALGSTHDQLAALAMANTFLPDLLKYQVGALMCMELRRDFKLSWVDRMIVTWARLKSGIVVMARPTLPVSFYLTPPVARAPILGYLFAGVMPRGRGTAPLRRMLRGDRRAQHALLQALPDNAMGSRGRYENWLAMRPETRRLALANHLHRGRTALEEVYSENHPDLYRDPEPVLADPAFAAAATGAAEEPPA